MNFLALLPEIIATTLVLVYVAAIIAALEAALRTRTSQGAIAWAISLITFPYIALPLYLVFGRNKFDGYLEQRQEVEREAEKIMTRASDALSRHILPATAETPLYTSLYQLTRIPATSGNELQLLVNGQATFDSIVEGLRAAEKYILFQFYIIRDDDLGRRLGRVLADKARDGVKVFLLYDEVGSRPFPRSRLHRQLQMTGVRVVPFNTTQGRRNRFQLNFRNHRKVVVVDGRQAWVGGHNVGVEYLGLKKRVGHWRDTHVRVRGPAVMGVAQAFATDWLWATRKFLPDINWESGVEARGDCDVLVFPSDPASEFEEAGLMFHQVIVSAQQRVWIASPYFVPDHAIISALQLAALRGVDVRLIIPDEPDGPVVGMANWSYTRELLPAGVRVFRYRGGFMHQKVLLMDDTVAGVGTANFDNRSFRLNFEITLLVRNEGFAAEVDHMLREDLARCREVSRAEVDGKSVWFHLGMSVARLFAPVL
jgi:cardiolipin synthase